VKAVLRRGDGSGTDAGPALEVTGLVAGHGGVPAVHGIDLVVERGEIVALLGPNGAGKTTTLMTVAGVLPVLSGDVRVLGEDTRGRSVHRLARRGMSIVPEDRGVFFQLTVAENLRLRRTSRSRMTCDEVYARFPALAPLAGKRVGLLSGGEQQMVALGGALLSGPDLLMLDEMSHGLAPVVVAQLLPQLRSTARETGLSVLLVEQHVSAALGIADRAYVLNRGHLVLAGTAEHLRSSPELLEAGYLGGAEPTPAVAG